MRKALSKAFAIGITDLPTFTRLLNVAKDAVTIDQSLDRGDLLNLVNRFKELQPSDIQSFSLPVTNANVGGASVLRLDEAAAQATLDVFRGRDPAELAESQLTVQVFNGSGTAGQARDVRLALKAVGFVVGTAGNAPASDATVIQYAPGSEAAADLLARHLTSPAVLLEDASLGANELAIVTGKDFTTVMQTPRSPQTTTTTVPPADSVDTPTDSIPANGVPESTTTSTTVVGVVPGEAPPGVAC